MVRVLSKLSCLILSFFFFFPLIKENTNHHKGDLNKSILGNQLMCCFLKIFSFDNSTSKMTSENEWMQLRKKRTAEEGEMSENSIEIAQPLFFYYFFFYWFSKSNLIHIFFWIKSCPVLLFFFFPCSVSHFTLKCITIW